MMHAVVFAVIAVSSQYVVLPEPPDHDVVARLAARGLSTGDADLDAALGKAFQTQDRYLLSDLLVFLRLRERLAQHADTLLSLYINSKDPFKESVSADVDSILATVERIARSRYGYDIYARAVRTLKTGNRPDQLAKAVLAVESIAQYTGLDMEPYLIRALFSSPPDAGVCIGWFAKIRYLKIHLFPEMSYHIYMRFKNTPFFVQYGYERIYGEQARPFLECETPPGPDALATMLVQADSRISADEIRLREEYAAADPAPYVR